MKTATKIVATLLGLMFITFGLNFWFHFKFLPAPPELQGDAKQFMGAMFGSGYLATVKAVEVLGGLALLCSCTRRLVIILIGAVTFNIATFHVAFFGWGSLLDPVVIFAIVGTLFLVRSHRLCCCLTGFGKCNPEGSGCCGSSCCSEKEESSCCSTSSSEKKSGGCGCN